MDSKIRKFCRFIGGRSSAHTMAALAEDFKVSKDAFVWEEGSTFTPAADDYKPTNIMITGGAGFIAR